MGSPGSGKTSLGKLIGKKLGMITLDIDDDLLEKHWLMSVAEKVMMSFGRISSLFMFIIIVILSVAHVIILITESESIICKLLIFSKYMNKNY